MPQSLPSLKPRTRQPASSSVALPFSVPGRAPKMQNVVGNGRGHTCVSSMDRYGSYTGLKRVVPQSANASFSGKHVMLNLLVILGTRPHVLELAQDLHLCYVACALWWGACYIEFVVNTSTVCMLALCVWLLVMCNFGRPLRTLQACAQNYIFKIGIKLADQLPACGTA
jgi:hypothetical protein